MPPDEINSLLQRIETLEKRVQSLEKNNLPRWQRFIEYFVGALLGSAIAILLRG